MRHQFTCNAGVKVVLFGLALGGCVEGDERPNTIPLSAERMIALHTRVLDCEARAARQVDGSRADASAVAEQVMSICTPERLTARKAFHLRLDDPDIDHEDLKSAVDIVVAERASRKNSN